MARAMWSGSISFGLVNIPVKMHTANRDRDIHFHMLSKDGTCRLRRKLFCPETGEEFDFNETARGYEIAPGQYVLIKDEELAALKPESGRTIDILDFVDLADIDPVYYERTYYLMPDQKGAKAYRLLFEAMERAGKVGIARFSMRAKEYLAAIRPINDGYLALQTMYHADEVVKPEEIAEPVKSGAVDKREVEMAQKLIETLVAPFKPEKYKDDYRDKVMELIERKAAGESVVTQDAPAERPHRVINLMEALQKSLASAKRDAGHERKDTRPERASGETGRTTKRSKTEPRKPARESGKAAPARKSRKKTA
jgi:DNA end-binding protein Ku